jgi:hypothetical protein
MPGGHASHKGSSVKPNTNANNQLDTAADLGVNPEDILQEEGYPERTTKTPQSKPEATQKAQEENA